MMKSLFRHTNNTRLLIKDSYRYIRSDLPSVVDEDEKQLLIDHNVLTIVDLRSKWECEERACAFAGDDRFTVLSLPTTGGPKMPQNMGGSKGGHGGPGGPGGPGPGGHGDPGMPGGPNGPDGPMMPKGEGPEGGKQPPMGPMGPSSFAEYTESYIKMTDDNMRNIIRTIEAAPTGVLYFCGAGKDRTGVVSALLLKHMGKSDEEIILDYVLSAIYSEKMFLEDEKHAPGRSMAVNAPNAITMYHYLEAIRDFAF